MTSLPVQEGPCVVGPLPTVVVSGVVIKRESLFLWVDGGKVTGWMPITDLPQGGTRRGDWLVWTDGHELQVIKDRAHTTGAVSKEAPNVKGRDLARRAEAGDELNRDLEHFVASGNSIEHARHQTLHAHEDVLVEMIQGTFKLFSVWAGMSAAEGSIEQLGEGMGRGLKSVTAKTPNATPEQNALADIFRRSQTLVAEFPHLGFLAPTESNLAGMKRLSDLYDDMHLSPELREQFLAEVKAQVGTMNAPPEQLFEVMKNVAHAKPDVYLRKGPATSGEYIQKMGGLRRAISIKAACFSLTTDEWYAKARQASDGKLPRNRADLKCNADRLASNRSR